MTLYVTDANIFIDLHHADLLDHLDGLGLSLTTSSFVLDELNARQQAAIRQKIELGLIEILEVLPEEIQLAHLPRGLSLPDRSVIALALRVQGVLLSGDGLVRRTAQDNGLAVHGLIWIFDRLLEAELLLPARAAELLEFLVEQKRSRQPEREYRARIDRWRAL